MTTPQKPNLNDGGQRTLEAIRHLVGAHGERLDGHDAQLGEHAGRMDGHEATLTAHDGRLAALEKAREAAGDGHDGG